LTKCSAEALIELNALASNIEDYSFFDYNNLYSIFTTSPDYALKKSAIEQLSILINDRSDNLGESGRKLFREKQNGKDIFSICVLELLMMHKLADKNGINKLHPVELAYVQKLLRFLALSFLFYFDEAVVIDLLEPYVQFQDSQDFENSNIYFLIESLKLFLSSKSSDIRKHTLRCLQLILLNNHIKIWFPIISTKNEGVQAKFVKLNTLKHIF
jgi:hypothetical protein